MTIAVLCEAHGEGPLELVSRARLIAPDAHVVAIREEGGYPEAQFAALGADEIRTITVCEDDCAQAERIAGALRQISPDAALFPATVRGRFLSARAAARLDTGLTADCTELTLDAEGLLHQIRPAFGGNLIAEILCREKRPQMASVRPGIFPISEESGSARPAITSRMDLPCPPQRMRRVGFEPSDSKVPLQTARIVVAGGKGIGGSRGFAKLGRLAGLLGGVVGATRSAVDAGWIGYAHQIGQTGVAVRPELYLAFGISGCIQHTVGMNASATVLAVNTDRNAPIFSCADYGIVDDWEKTADAMIARLEKGRTRP